MITNYLLKQNIYKYFLLVEDIAIFRNTNSSLILKHTQAGPGDSLKMPLATVAVISLVTVCRGTGEAVD